jgi:hypothetical protein
MGRIKRFSNRAQLVRHVAENTSLTEEEVWEKIERQT